MTRRDGTGKIAKDGGTVGYSRPGGRGVPLAFYAALVRVLDSSGLLKADHYSLQALVCEQT